jgi:hypothetical protein
MPRQIFTLYYNPGCSKCRAVRALLEERDVALRIVEYLKQPPTRAELADLRRKLGLPAKRWIRKGDAAFATAGEPGGGAARRDGGASDLDRAPHPGTRRSSGRGPAAGAGAGAARPSKAVLVSGVE